jgi:hypothetical protein
VKRSTSLSAEIGVMDKIERAMAAVDDLPEASAKRVRRWVQETYLDGQERLTLDLAAVPQGRPVPDRPQA